MMCGKSNMKNVMYRSKADEEFDGILTQVRQYINQNDTNGLSQCLDHLVCLYKEEKLWCVLHNDIDCEFMRIHRVIRSIDDSMKELQYTSAFVLYEQYFQQEFKYWYLEYYSVSTYYRHRKRALFEFFSKLIEINDKMAL